MNSLYDRNLHSQKIAELAIHDGTVLMYLRTYTEKNSKVDYTRMLEALVEQLVKEKKFITDTVILPQKLELNASTFMHMD